MSQCLTVCPSHQASNFSSFWLRSLSSFLSLATFRHSLQALFQVSLGLIIHWADGWSLKYFVLFCHLSKIFTPADDASRPLATYQDTPHTAHVRLVRIATLATHRISEQQRLEVVILISLEDPGCSPCYSPHVLG